MAAGAVHPSDVAGIHPAVLEQPEQVAAVGAYAAGMVHLRARPGQSQGLIQPLAAAEGLHTAGGDGFSGTDGMVHRINQIPVERAEIQNFHKPPPLSLLCIKNAGKCMGDSASGKRRFPHNDIMAPAK